MSNPGETEDELRAHLEDVEDGAGCTEIWERMSEMHERADDQAAVDNQATADDKATADD